MQFNIKYNRIGNKFFFISNLSEWHFSCRDYYNEIWLNEVGPLTREEKDSLFEIREILQKYDFNKYLGLFFMTSNENTVWSLLKKHIEEEEVHILKKVFKVFEEKFKKVWRPRVLDENIKVLKKELLKKTPEILSDIEILFGKIRRKNFNVYLIQHPFRNNYIAGGANLGTKGITLECNQILKKESEVLNDALSTIYHEFLHLVFGKKMRDIIRYFFVDNRKSKIIPYLGVRNLTEEVIIHSLFGKYGFLANKYFYKCDGKKLNSDFKKFKKIFELIKKNTGVVPEKKMVETFFFLALNFRILIKKYLDGKKKIDKNFVENITYMLK